MNSEYQTPHPDPHKCVLQSLNIAFIIANILMRSILLQQYGVLSIVENRTFSAVRGF